MQPIGLIRNLLNATKTPRRKYHKDFAHLSGFVS